MSSSFSLQMLTKGRRTDAVGQNICWMRDRSEQSQQQACGEKITDAALGHFVAGTGHVTCAGALLCKCHLFERDL